MANNTLVASDGFVRANGALGANWTALPTFAGGQIVSNQVEPTATSTNCGQFWNANVFPNDQTSEVTIGTGFISEAGSVLTLIVRSSAGVATWYQAAITNSTAQISKVIAGSPTTLGALASGLTIASGNVWALTAVGACITLYQNYKRIAYFYDGAIASGAPGFAESSTVGITHVTVSSWRGYNPIQQDGIWQKQGITIPATTADLTPNGSAVFGVYQNTAILHEGNAQLLSGVVYKTWFTSGPPGSVNIFYAESLDGISWTRSVSPVLAAFTNPTIFKNGSTYNMYVQQQFPGNIFLFQSTDGINWAQISSTVLVSGTAGQWDSNGLFLLSVVGIIGGTWTGLYTGSSTANFSLYKLGLATSPDGITWTKSGSNPVLSNAVNSTAVVKVGSLYYGWFGGNQVGQGNASAPNQDPQDAVRYSSPDLITWTPSSPSLHHSQFFEGLNGNTGTCVPTAIININGKAYMYSISSPGDAIAPQIYQVGLAIAPVTIAQLITQPETALSSVAVDLFQRADGGLGANWTTITGQNPLQIVSHVVESTVVSTASAGAYTGAVFGNDQFCQVTIGALGVNGFCVLFVRGITSAATWYQLNVVGPVASLNTTQIAIFKSIAGATTQIGPFFSVTPQIGDVFTLSVIGNVLTAYQNGYIIGQVEDVNNSILSGSPGVQLDTIGGVLSGASITAFAGGNANVIPVYPPLPANVSSLSFGNSLKFKF